MLSATEKRELLAGLVRENHLTVGVETGIYNAGGSLLGMHPDPLEHLFVLDLSPANIAAVHSTHPTVTTVCGDSAWTMGEVCRRVELLGRPALFWLDAHLVDELDTDPMLDAFPNPIVDELTHVLGHLFAARANDRQGPVVAIDDLRLFGSRGWPPLDYVRNAVDPWFRRHESDDVMILRPR